MEGEEVQERCDEFISPGLGMIHCLEERILRQGHWDRIVSRRFCNVVEDVKAQESLSPSGYLCK